ncbi:MAG: prepilin-type N-terminal cleavage/methylation domain-containing protein [Candidatus Paceibacteria bacterium]
MRTSRLRGFSLIELLVVAAIMALFIGGLFVTIQTSLKLVAESRARMSALSVANDRLEYIRSLSYDAVGTISGLPAGNIPQVSTSTLNGFQFTERTLIEYIDDPADGLGASDSNSITTDYKRAKIEITWTMHEETESLVLVTTIVPRSIETNVGGGTIRVNVTDANVAPVGGASVRLLNTTGTTTVDVTKLTDSTGSVLFGGAPAGSGYQVFVTRAGYSSEQTYVATTSIPNPVLQPISLLAADISTVNVQIDALSTVALRLLSDRTEASSSRSFASSSELASSTNVAVVAGNLELASSAGVYQTNGVGMLTAVAPSSLARYETITVQESIPAQTARLIRVYASTTPDSLIPDTDLPGNSAGFVGNTIDISQLDTTTYPSLTIGVSLETSNTAVTPQVDAVTLYYTESETPLSTTFNWRGTKVIGSQLDFSPIYKHDYSTTTDTDGERLLNNVEWDTYQVTIAGYDIEEACTTHPLAVAPNTSNTLTLITTPDSAHSLRVVVTAGGMPLRNATVTLTRGSSDVETTGGCGQVFFDGLTSAADYQLSVSASGYTTATIDPVLISGDTVVEVAL